MILTLDEFLDKDMCEDIIEDFENIKNKVKFTDENVECHKYLEKYKWSSMIQKLLYNNTIISQPLSTSEEARVIKYKVGDTFRVHTDTPFIVENYRSPKFRLLIYLSDCEGGETYFPNYNVKVSPKAGRALIFPLDFAHEGLVVLKDFKYIIAYDLYYSYNRNDYRMLNDYDLKLLKDTQWFSTVYNVYDNILNKDYPFYYRIYQNNKLKLSTSNGITKAVFNTTDVCSERIDIGCDLMFFVRCKNIDKFDVKISLLNANKELLYKENQLKIENLGNGLLLIKPIIVSYPFEPASQYYVLYYSIEFDSENIELINTQLTALNLTSKAYDDNLNKKLYSYKNLSGPDGMFFRKDFITVLLSQNANEEEQKEIEKLKKSNNDDFPILNNLCLYYGQ